MQPQHSSTLLSEALNLPNPANQPAPEVNSVECPKPARFGFMFPELQMDQANLLPPGPETVRSLVELGMTMIDKDPNNHAFDSNIPSIYTYFGQFIVHDLTFDPLTDRVRFYKDDVENLTPFSVAEIKAIESPRTGLLDLDSVYGPILDNQKCYPVPVVNEAMKVEMAANSNLPGSDLPRDEHAPYKARIGDHRNDENLIISQLHLAFLRAHNVLIEAGASFEKAQAFLRRRYRDIVINDYLPRVVDHEDIAHAVNSKPEVFDSKNEFFMPVEFSAAAFRFGHAMIRSKYNYSPIRKLVRLDELFTLTALPPYHHILKDWIIDWNGFIPGGVNVARNLAPRLTEPLAEFLNSNLNTVPASSGQPKKPILSLAVIDLLRGYLLRLPTGQAVAQKLKLPSTSILSEAQIEEVGGAVSDEQRKVLQESGFSKQTPLWFYILAEAAHFQNGNRLGPVGGYIVATVLLECLQRSQVDDVKEEGWDPILGKEEGFDLAELLRHSGVLT